MKKQHLLGIRISVSLILLLIWAIACQEEENLTKSPMNKSQQEELELKTVSIEETKIILEDSRKDLHIKTRSSETENWTNFNMKDITQEPIIGSDQLMTIVSYAVQPDKGYSRALLFKASGLLCKSILSLYPNEESTAKLFSGTIVIRDFEGNFKLGFKVKEGKFIAKFVRNSANIPKTRGILSHRDKLFGDTKLPEVVVIALREYDPFLIDYLLPFELEDYYIFMNAYAFDYYKGQHGNGGGGGSSSPNKGSLHKIDETDIVNTKVECVKDALETGGDNSLLNQFLEGFKLEKSKINVVYKTGTVPNKSTGGKTVPDLHDVNSPYGDLIVTIDLDKWMNRTSIGLAYTVLHETLHAYLFGQKWAKDLHNNAGGVEVSFADLWEEYESIYGQKQTQHQFMATHYIEPMKKAMKSYFEQLAYYDSFMNYVADNTEWKGVDAMMEALVWRGLKGTETWKSLSEAAKKEINKQDNLFLRKDLNKPENCE